MNAQFTGLKTRRDHSISTHVRSTILHFPIHHFFQLGAPYSIVVCQFHPLISKTLDHRLLPTPDSEAPSMTLCAQFLFQAPKPCHNFMQEQIACFSFRISHPDTCNITTTNNSWRTTFRHHEGTCVLPCSCAAALPNLSHVFLHVPQRVLVHQSSFSACGPALRADVHIVYVL